MLYAHLCSCKMACWQISMLMVQCHRDQRRSTLSSQHHLTPDLPWLSFLWQRLDDISNINFGSWSCNDGKYCSPLSDQGRCLSSPNISKLNLKRRTNNVKQIIALLDWAGHHWPLNRKDCIEMFVIYLVVCFLPWLCLNRWIDNGGADRYQLILTNKLLAVAAFFWSRCWLLPPAPDQVPFIIHGDL